MSTKHGTERSRFVADQRGVIYVEQLAMVGLALLLAAVLALAGVMLFAPRYQGIAAAIYAGVP